MIKNAPAHLLLFGNIALSVRLSCILDVMARQCDSYQNACYESNKGRDKHCS